MRQKAAKLKEVELKAVDLQLGDKVAELCNYQ